MIKGSVRIAASISGETNGVGGGHRNWPGFSMLGILSSRARERARFSSEFISALLRDFRQGGPAAIAKVRNYQPAAYMKICALLVPREMKVEHSGGVKAMTDEQIEAAIEAIQCMLEARAGEQAKVIEGGAEPGALCVAR